MDLESAKKKKPAKKKVSPKKDKDRKPNYDEKDVPKVLKGLVVPELRKDYDAPMMGPGCGCGGPGPLPTPGIPEMPIPEMPIPEMPIPDGPGPDALVPPGAMVDSPIEGPGGSPMMMLECPSCHQQAPLEFDLPEGVPIDKLALQCFGCGEKIPFGKIMNQGNGMYAVSQ